MPTHPFLVQYDGRDDTPASGNDSDSASDGGKPRPGAARSRGRVMSRGSAAGPPVDGALARVDAWPPDCDIHGHTAGKVAFLTPSGRETCALDHNLWPHHDGALTTFQPLPKKIDHPSAIAKESFKQACRGLSNLFNWRWVPGT